MDSSFWFQVFFVSAVGLLLALWHASRTGSFFGLGSGRHGNGNGHGDGHGDVAKAPPRRKLTGYARLIRQAGHDPQYGRSLFWAAKLMLAALLPLIFMEWTFGSLYDYRALFLGLSPNAVLGVVGFFLPDLWLLRARARRRWRIRRDLSFYLDLVVALLNSGMPLDRAVERAARDGFGEPNPLADEMDLLAREMRMGRDRTEAFGALSERTGVPELNAVASALQMSFQTGAVVQDTLSSQADLMRIKRRELANRKIHSSTVISMFPVFLCGVPLFIVLVYFPAFVEIMETFTTLRGG